MDKSEEENNCSLQCNWKGCSTKIILVAVVTAVIVLAICLFIFYRYIRGHVNKGIKTIEKLTSVSNIIESMSSVKSDNNIVQKLLSKVAKKIKIPDVVSDLIE